MLKGRDINIGNRLRRKAESSMDITTFGSFKTRGKALSRNDHHKQFSLGLAILVLKELHGSSLVLSVDPFPEPCSLISFPKPGLAPEYRDCG